LCHRGREISESSRLEVTTEVLTGVRQQGCGRDTTEYHRRAKPMGCGGVEIPCGGVDCEVTSAFGVLGQRGVWRGPGEDDFNDHLGVVDSSGEGAREHVSGGNLREHQRDPALSFLRQAGPRGCTIRGGVGVSQAASDGASCSDW
jgi:hypothetical protein